jgi:uncharacterized protein (TIGR03435 family)
MRSIFTSSSLFLLGAGLALAQKPTFDVASIKAAAPQTDGRIMISMGGDPGMIDYKHVSLRMLVTRAFGVKDYQVTGPDWMNSEFFDVQAKHPPNTPKEVENQMLQTLLEERFGLKFHKEGKEVPIYSLVAGKNGPKLKKAEELPPNATADGKPPAPGGSTGFGGPSAGGPSVGGGGGGGMVAGSLRTNTNTNVDGGRGGRIGGPGSMMMRMEGPGKMHLTAKAMQVSNFTDFLARQVDRPVFDNTGITGYYDIEMDFKPEGGGMGRGMMIMPPGAHPPSNSDGPAPDGVEAPSIFTALQDQLGLKLEAKKGPIDTIVVDHIEKTPIEN